jgi:hypothetical protein
MSICHFYFYFFKLPPFVGDGNASIFILFAIAVFILQCLYMKHKKNNFYYLKLFKIIRSVK